jgi:hypothetical protein
MAVDLVEAMAADLAVAVMAAAVAAMVVDVEMGWWWMNS